jgi:hypothetical protein
MAESHLVGGYLKYPDLIYLIPFLILENKCKIIPKLEKNNHQLFYIEKIYHTRLL